MRESCRISPVTSYRFSNYAARNTVEVIKQGTRNGCCMRNTCNSREIHRKLPYEHPEEGGRPKLWLDVNVVGLGCHEDVWG